MAVRKPGRYETSLQVDDLGVGADMGADRGVGPGGDEAAVLDRESLSDGGAGIRGEDLAVDEHQIGGVRRLRGDDCRRERRNDDGERTSLEHDYQPARTAIQRPVPSTTPTPTMERIVDVKYG